MTVSLGGIVLNPSMIWVDRYASHGIAQTRKRSLGGLLHLSSVQLIAGREVNLQATDTSGWLTRQQVLDVTALADSLDATYTLVFGGDSLQVAFRHFDPPAVEFSPIVPRTDDHVEVPGWEDYMVGTIKLITV